MKNVTVPEVVQSRLEDIRVVLGLGAVYLNGGAVRDIFLGREPKDYDVSVHLNEDELWSRVNAVGNRFADIKMTDKSGLQYGRVEITVRDMPIDVVCMRGETYTLGSRKPKVSYGVSLHEDMMRRDFTINANYLKWDGEYWSTIKHSNADRDFTRKYVRSVVNPEERNIFVEDPLRILRAYEIATRLNYTVEFETSSAIKYAIPMLQTLAPEKAYPFLEKILNNCKSKDVKHPYPLRAAFDVFKAYFPQLHATPSVPASGAHTPMLDVIIACVNLECGSKHHHLRQIAGEQIIRNYGVKFGVGKEVTSAWQREFELIVAQ